MPEGVNLDDLHAYMPTHSYIFAPSREMWPASSVNARIPPVAVTDDKGNAVLDDRGKPKITAASAWLDRNRPVEQMTWCPGKPMIIRDRLVDAGGWIDRKGVSCFNLYRPPDIEPGDASKADLWLNHVERVYPNDHDHVVRWLAHRRQRPEDKINHSLVLGGAPGVGKDTLLEPVKRAVGPWNFVEITPTQMLGRFNSFVKSVILRINEARDLGEFNRFAFYDHMKGYAAAPPDVLRCDEKNLREHSAFNVTGVIITTNHKADGIYLPPDDRRHYVAWSNLAQEDFSADYWERLWTWYARGGNQHVAAYLDKLDISEFNPKAPPPKTPAFWDIVFAGRSPEDAELADALDKLGNPIATTMTAIESEASAALLEWMRDRKNRRVISYRMETCGYVPARNPDAKDGLWKLNGVRQVIYVKKDVSALRDQIAAAKNLINAFPNTRSTYQ
jgi:hypothetical protein